MNRRSELEAQSVCPFKHALVLGQDTYPVTKVRTYKERVRITSDTMVFIMNKTRPVTVELIENGDDDHDPDPVRSATAQNLARRAAKPSWRLGRYSRCPGRSPVRPR